MSAQIRKERNEYYECLEKSQSDSMDITDWILWFMACLDRSVKATEADLVGILDKAKFWEQHHENLLNERQRMMLNKLLDGFEGKTTTGKWSKIAKCSTDTALRDIQSLIDQNILEKENAGGRSTSYRIRMSL
ncbi:MAG: hypothetical protein RI909_476 [Bacteroidota bacterium]|jgi:Fic family protein